MQYVKSVAEELRRMALRNQYHSCNAADQKQNIELDDKIAPWAFFLLLIG